MQTGQSNTVATSAHFGWMIVVLPFVAVPLITVSAQFIPFFIFYLLYKVIIEKHGEGDDFASRFTWNSIQEGLQVAVTDLYNSMKGIWNSIVEFTSPVNRSSPNERPSDINENEDGYTDEIDIPGYSKDSISVIVDGFRVVVSATQERNEKDHSINERTSKPFNRVVTFPGTADMSTLMTKAENGVLTLCVSKSSLNPPDRKIIKIEWLVCLNKHGYSVSNRFSFFIVKSNSCLIFSR